MAGGWAWTRAVIAALFYLIRTDFHGVGWVFLFASLRNIHDLRQRYGPESFHSLYDNLGPYAGYIKLALGTIFALFLGFFTLSAFIDTFARDDCTPSTKPGLDRPLFFPCQTVHTRIFPKKHSFIYFYLLVGIPVGWEGNSGGMISSARKTREHTSKDGLLDAWYHVDAAGYLERGQSNLGLRERLDRYLKSQDVKPSQYPHAYLATAAKFMGYSSNPVSFWYLYTSDRRLGAMILEVNNTFDERHMYFLEKGKDKDQDATSDGGEEGGDLSFRKKWPKDFHVSPFNSRKGSYSLVTGDPFSRSSSASSTCPDGPIHATITLNSSKQHPKLVARIYSTGEPIDPVALGPWEKLRFLLSWWWVGFLTIPRTIKEAFNLWLKSMHIWHKPEPLKTTISCRANDTERKAEYFFRIYLKHLVSTTTNPLIVEYTAAGLDEHSVEVMESPKAKKSTSTKTLQFKVLTPVFYTRYLHYPHDVEAMCREFQENGTLWLSNVTLAVDLVLRQPKKVRAADPYHDNIYLHFMARMRKPPPPIERLITSSDVPKREPIPFDKHNPPSPSAMDSFFMSQVNPLRAGAYKQLVLHMMFAERYTFGWMWPARLMFSGSQYLQALFFAFMVDALFRATFLS